MYNTFKQYLYEDIDDKFEEYRGRIKDAYNIDIKDYVDSISGGKADDACIHKITKYPVDQIIKGIKVEMEHTEDPLKALEIVLDHLTEFEKQNGGMYYDHLDDMEKQIKGDEE